MARWRQGPHLCSSVVICGCSRGAAKGRAGQSAVYAVNGYGPSIPCLAQDRTDRKLPPCLCASLLAPDKQLPLFSASRAAALSSQLFDSLQCLTPLGTSWRGFCCLRRRSGHSDGIRPVTASMAERRLCHDSATTLPQDVAVFSRFSRNMKEAPRCKSLWGLTCGKLAERAGFEPAVRQAVQRLSRPPPSTTRPPLRQGSYQTDVGRVQWANRGNRAAEAGPDAASRSYGAFARRGR